MMSAGKARLETQAIAPVLVQKLIVPLNLRRNLMIHALLLHTSRRPGRNQSEAAELMRSLGEPFFAARFRLPT